MASKTLFLAVGLLLVLAGLVAYVTLEGGSTREAAVREVPAAPAQPTGGATALQAASASDSPAEPQQASLGERAAVAPVAQAPAAEAAGAAKATTTRLVGQVLDSRGRPVAGADLTLEPGFGPTVFRDGQTRPPKGQSNADGAFELLLSSATGGTLKVGADGFAPLEREVAAVVPGAVTDLGAIVLASGAEVSGRVLDSSGRPVEGAKVRLGRSDVAGPRISMGAFFGTEAALATSDAAGEFRVSRLPLGPFRLDFDSDRHPMRAVEGHTDELAPRLSGLVVELPDGASIEGRVVGFPADREGYAVLASRAGGTGPVMAFGSGSAERRGPIGPNGSFRVDGLVPGAEYRLWIGAAEVPDSPRAGMRLMGQGAGGPSVNATAGARDVELAWSEPASLTFRALESGTLVPVERFQATFEGGGRTVVTSFGGGSAPTVWKEGRATLRSLTVREGGPGTLRILADGYEAFERTGIELQPGQTLDLGDLLLRSAPSIEVTVRDLRDGTPVVGATVRLALAPAPLAPGERRVGMRVGGAFGGRAMMRGGDGEGSRSARTDERGVALVASPGTGLGTLTVESAQHAPFAIADVPMPTEGRTSREVALTLGGSVRVAAFDPDGAPLAGARVEHRPPGDVSPMSFFGGSEPLVSDQDGVVLVERLEPGVHRFRIDNSTGPMGGLSFSVAGMSEGGAPWSEVTVVQDARADLRLVAERLGSLEGRVREAGKALAGAELSLVPRESEAGFTLASVRGLLGGGGGVQTDGEGRYRLADLRPGSYHLRISHPRRALPEEIPIEIAAQAQRRDVDLSVTAIEGRVLDGQGKPVAGLRVRAERPATEGVARGMRAMMVMANNDGEESGVLQVGDASSGGAARTDADGRYRLNGLPSDTDLQVVVSGPQVREVKSGVLRLSPDEVKSGVNLVAEAAGSVRVRVIGPDGKPRGMFILNAAPADDRELQAVPAFVGPDGQSTLRGLEPGPWWVRIMNMGPNPQPAAERRVDVVAGETAEVTLEVTD